MGIVLIIAGLGLISWTAQSYRVIEPQRAVIFQGPVGGLIQMVVSLGAIALVVWGAIRLFS
jgi:hypothetical protein